MVVIMNCVIVDATQEALCTRHIIYHRLSYCCNWWKSWSAGLLHVLCYTEWSTRYKVFVFLCITASSKLLLFLHQLFTRSWHTKAGFSLCIVCLFIPHKIFQFE